MIKKAVVLAAGKGTRMLSITGEKSKEMLLLNNKPIILYSIEEAFKADCEEICIVLNKEKRDLLDYLHVLIKSDPRVKIIFREPAGMMDALYSVKDFVNNDAFFVILPDMLYIDEINATERVKEAYNKFNHCIIGLTRATGELGKGSFAKVTRVDNNIYQVQGITEFSGDVRFFGRYIFTPEIFHYLEKLPHEESEKDLLLEIIKNDKLYGVLFEKNVFDTGIPKGYISAKKSLEGYKYL